MNDLRDVKRLIDDHITAPGRQLTAASNFDNAAAIITTFKRAEEKVAEGLRKLNALKLSANDRKHMRLLRDCFKTTIKAMEAGRKGNVEKCERLLGEATGLSFRYATLMLKSEGDRV